MLYNRMQEYERKWNNIQNLPTFPWAKCAQLFLRSLACCVSRLTSPGYQPLQVNVGFCLDDAVLLSNTSRQQGYTMLYRSNINYCFLNCKKLICSFQIEIMLRDYECIPPSTLLSSCATKLQLPLMENKANPRLSFIQCIIKIGGNSWTTNTSHVWGKRDWQVQTLLKVILCKWMFMCKH